PRAGSGHTSAPRPSARAPASTTTTPRALRTSRTSSRLGRTRRQPRHVRPGSPLMPPAASPPAPRAGPPPRPPPPPPALARAGAAGGGSGGTCVGPPASCGRRRLPGPREPGRGLRHPLLGRRVDLLGPVAHLGQRAET